MAAMPWFNCTFDGQEMQVKAKSYYFIVAQLFTMFQITICSNLEFALLHCALLCLVQIHRRQFVFTCIRTTSAHLESALGVCRFY